MLQLLCTSDLDMTLERYIEVVKSKTAVLLSAACEAGAILGKASPEQELALHDFGMDLGIAFQLMDDTLDYTASEEQFGKEIGHDLEEGKITLPLIHTLSNCTGEERDVITAVVEKEVLEPGDFEAVFTLVHRYGGIQYTTEVAGEYISRCKEHLNAFPDSTEKSALIDIADYVISRNR